MGCQHQGGGGRGDCVCVCVCVQPPPSRPHAQGGGQPPVPVPSPTHPRARRLGPPHPTHPPRPHQGGVRAPLQRPPTLSLGRPFVPDPSVGPSGACPLLIAVLVALNNPIGQTMADFVALASRHLLPQMFSRPFKLPPTPSTIFRGRGTMGACWHPPDKYRGSHGRCGVVWPVSAPSAHSEPRRMSKLSFIF